MRLTVTFKHYSPSEGVNLYEIVACDEVRAELHPDEVREVLRSLVPRIEKMAVHILGDQFADLTHEPDLSGALVLKVGAKTSTNPKTKFPFRELLGWIALCDEELEPL